MNSTPATNLTEPADDYSLYAEYTASVWIWTIYPPILIILGTIGNILSIIVLTQKSMRESTVSIYLIALSVVDISVLYTGLLRQWMRIVFGVDIRQLSELSCKIHLWMNYFTLSMSVWLLVAVTVERFLSVWVPHKVKTYCSRCTSIVTIAAITVFLLALCSHVMYGLGDVIVTSDGVTTFKRCEELWDDYSYFLTHIWPLIALMHFSLLPFIVLFVANLYIIYKVMSRSRKAHHVISALTSQQIKKQAKKMSSMTLTLLVLNTVFCVCTLPVCIFIIVRPYWSCNATAKHRAELMLIEAIVDNLMYTNSAVNFVMYCTSGSRFRETLNILYNKSKKALTLKQNGKQDSRITFFQS